MYKNNLIYFTLYSYEVHKSVTVKIAEVPNKMEKESEMLLTSSEDEEDSWMEDLQRGRLIISAQVSFSKIYASLLTNHVIDQQDKEELESPFINTSEHQRISKATLLIFENKYFSSFSLLLSSYALD